MKIRNLIVFALLPAAAIFTGCSSDPETPSTPADSAVLDTAPDGFQLDTGTEDSQPVDTALPVDSATDDASEETTTDGATAETSEAGAKCTSGAVQSEACGKCGTRSRLCVMSAWLDWSACNAETGACVPGDTRTLPCERCGTQKQTCSATCEWSAGACLEQKTCESGAVETRTGYCLDTTKRQSRTCAATCSWSAWSEC